MQDLKVNLVQTSLHWEDIDANLAMLEEKLWEINDNPDLIVLPEMFTTGFSMNAEKLAEPMNLKTFKWMKQMAAQLNAVLMGSYIVKEGGFNFNRLIVMRPDGTHDRYNKRHPFRLANEHQTYEPGKERLIVDIKGWKICPMICYDLRFPVWARNRYKDSQLDYDVLVYVANWPAPRVNAWDGLLTGRAIENLSYCIGVNRVGSDEEGHQYLGHSAVYDFSGKKLFFNEGEELTTTVSLKYEEMQAFRQKFAFYLDADDFELKGGLI